MKSPGPAGAVPATARPLLRTAALVGLFALVFAVRLPYLSDSPYGYDSWRQSDTEAMARNFTEHRFNVWFPQLNYQGPMPNYAQLELQITTGLIAVLYELFGYHYPLARLVPILFFMGSALFVYRIALRHFSPFVAGLSVVLYGLLPLNVLYSRAIMPESAALFFYTGAFYWFGEWIARGKRNMLFVSALFTALAVCEKVPAVFVGIPMVVMVLVKYGWRAAYRPELWAFIALALLPPFAYYRWLGTVAESAFVSGIASKHILPAMASAMLAKEAWAFFAAELPKAFTWCGLGLSLLGFAMLRLRSHYAIVAWMLAMLAELATIVAVIRFNYYLIFIGPLVSLLGAYAVGALLERTIRHSRTRLANAAAGLGIAVAVGLAAGESFATVAPVIGRQNADILQQAAVVERYAAPEDLVVVGTDDPSLLNASHRAGWRVTNSIPGDPIGELDYFVREGAAYFAPLKGYIDGDPEGRLKTYLNERYVKLEADTEYYIYKLR
ncbi:MAG: glycosyl transferase family 39 [Paenibacillus sp.]|nr:glycosyl transferase family 39 [Paenibacillus sp.]